MCFASDGLSLAPDAWVPARHPSAGSQIPDKSRTGAGPGFWFAGRSSTGRPQPSTCTGVGGGTGVAGVFWFVFDPDWPGAFAPTGNKEIEIATANVTVGIISRFSIADPPH